MLSLVNNNDHTIISFVLFFFLWTRKCRDFSSTSARTTWLVETERKHGTQNNILMIPSDILTFSTSTLLFISFHLFLPVFFSLLFGLSLACLWISTALKMLYFNFRYVLLTFIFPFRYSFFLLNFRFVCVCFTSFRLYFSHRVSADYLLVQKETLIISLFFVFVVRNRRKKKYTYSFNTHILNSLRSVLTATTEL